MKKIFKVALGALLAVSVTPAAFGYGYDLYQYSTVYAIGDYTRPSNNGLSIGDARTLQIPGFDGTRTNLFLQPKYRIDYTLGINFDLGCDSVGFFQFDHLRDHRTRGTLGVINIGAPGGAAPGNGSANVDEHFNDFILGLGHWLHFGDSFDLNVSAYVEYLRLSRSLTEQNLQLAPIRTNNRFTSSSMKGIGPGISILGRAFPFESSDINVFASVMTTLFYARNNYDQTYTLNGALGYEYNPEQTKSVTGKFEIDFGIGFTEDFAIYREPFAFDLALGMRYMNVINAFKNGNTAFNENVQAGAALANFAANTGTPQDWGRWGPFLQIGIAGW